MDDSTKAVRIVPYQPAFRRHFYELNAAWITQHFEIEPPDELVLSDPEREILGKGGCIWFALIGDQVVGTCALKPDPDGAFELSKMAVSPNYQRRGIGEQLIAAVIHELEARPGAELYLETNAKLEPALRLYERMGFVRQASLRPGSPFARADVHMIYQRKFSNSGQRDTE